MSMVGTFMQAFPPYETFGGVMEVLGGLLLLHRRTALLGAFVAIGVMTNVCALNWLCGVPVKLYSAHLLLEAVALLAPFAPQLGAVFVANRASAPIDLRVVRSARAGRWLTALGTAWVVAFLASAHLQGVAPKPWMKGFAKSALYGLWTVETMRLDGVEVPQADALRWRCFAIDAGNRAWAREATGVQHSFELRVYPNAGIALVEDRTGRGRATALWTCAVGTKITKVDPPLLLHNEERGKRVDGERRTLLLRGRWQGRELELRTVEKVFRLQTGFRLRQELPDFW